MSPPLRPDNGTRFTELLEKAKTCLSLAELEAVSAALEGEKIAEKVQAKVEAARASWQLLEAAGVKGAREATTAWDGYIRQIKGRELERATCGSFAAYGLGGTSTDHLADDLLYLTSPEPPAGILIGHTPMLAMLRLHKHPISGPFVSRRFGARVFQDGFHIHGVAARYDSRLPADEIRFYWTWPVTDLDAWCGRQQGWTA